MTLQILDGPLKSTGLPMKKNFIFSSLFFKDDEMKMDHAKVFLDHNFNWKINGLDGNRIRVGTDEIESLSLIPGLIFHIGQTGFKVVEKTHSTSTDWEQVSAEFIDTIDLQTTPRTSIFFFLLLVQINFIQGPQAGTIYTLSYGPRILGSNHLDLDLKDPAQPHELLRFFQVGDKVVVENLAGESAILVNKTSFSQYTLAGSDRFTFGSNIIEVSILK